MLNQRLHEALKTLEHEKQRHLRLKGALITGTLHFNIKLQMSGIIYGGKDCFLTVCLATDRKIGDSYLMRYLLFGYRREIT
ncbi:hypothetical protein [Mucilaginibacter limnophilus]|uniref:hypothetical protein n=1 Tax=Mucilaginibacter limnophilus TaxID=1932778 RepID=UPI0013E40743|nr:hypothetical protein [Mucilaginibacter limnophilus]